MLSLDPAAHHRQLGQLDLATGPAGLLVGRAETARGEVFTNGAFENGANNRRGRSRARSRCSRPTATSNYGPSTSRLGRSDALRLGQRPPRGSAGHIPPDRDRAVRDCLDSLRAPPSKMTPARSTPAHHLAHPEFGRPVRLRPRLAYALKRDANVTSPSGPISWRTASTLPERCLVSSPDCRVARTIYPLPQQPRRACVPLASSATGRVDYARSRSSAPRGRDGFRPTRASRTLQPPAVSR